MAATGPWSVALYVRSDYHRQSVGYLLRVRRDGDERRVALLHVQGNCLADIARETLDEHVSGLLRAWCRDTLGQDLDVGQPGVP
jgi:hypothetical protein